MHFSTLLATAFALAAAEAKIAFTKVPGSSVTVGQPFTIEWDGAEAGAPVTITLKQGDPDNLSTVALLTGDATGNSYTWVPSSTLANGENYALEISQGTGFDTTNYSGEFAITGGSGSAASSTAGGSAYPTSMTVTMTSGNSTFVTSYSMYPAATGTGSVHTTTARNGTFTHSSKAASTGGGIVVTAMSTAVETATATAATTAASSTGNSGSHVVPAGGLAAILGLAALL